MAITRLNNNSIPSGNIIQVQSTFYNTPFTQSISADTDTSIDTTNLKVDITPTSTSSKIFLFGRLFQEWGNTSDYNVGFFFRRGTTTIGVGSASGSRSPVMVMNLSNYFNNAGTTPETASLYHVDSPTSVSQQTYYIGVRANNSSTIYVNRTVDDTDNNGNERGSSAIIAMEIKG